MVITWPVLSIMPGAPLFPLSPCISHVVFLAVIATLWGYFLFHENRGKRNVLIMSGAGVLCILSVTCTTLSKALTP